jgi:hypothetical protein
MENETDVFPESSPEEVAPSVRSEEVVSEDVKTPKLEPKSSEKVVPYDRFKEVNDELKRIKERPPVVKTTLDVEDYIDISASLDGLDQREKEFLAQQHKFSGKSLNEIRQSEDFTLWQSAYRAKVEKERLSLTPSSTQPDADKPQSLAERLASASLADKEKILVEAGLYKSPRSAADRVNIQRNPN